MLTVRLSDGTTIFAFGAKSVVARNTSGGSDTFWQQAAEASITEHGGDLYGGLVGLPGAQLIHDGPVGPSPVPAQLTTDEPGWSRG